MLHGDGGAAVAAHVAAGRCIESQATADGRVHSVVLATEEVARVQAQVESASDVELQFVDAPVQECELGEVRGAEGGRAGRVGHEVGTSEVEDEAEAVGDDGLHVGATLCLRALDHAVPVVLVQAHRAASVVRVAVGDLLGDAHLEEVLGARLQHHPLHRIHDSGLAKDDLEVLVVEQLHALNHRLVFCGALPRLEGVLVRVVVILDVPPCVRDLHTGVATTIEAAVVGASLIVAGHEACCHVHDLELLADRPRGTLAGEEESRVALPIVERELRGLLQERGRQGERLLAALALVVEATGPEDEDGVRFGLELDRVLLDGQRARGCLSVGLQRH
mmetsp:Transcript_114852/g.319895  ORF Transcript_114852/g.319895 Transcript_114852/m.319895 type:complete len:334 (+) Transcript_114852:1188-2189(+)